MIIFLSFNFIMKGFLWKYYILFTWYLLVWRIVGFCSIFWFSGLVESLCIINRVLCHRIRYWYTLPIKKSKLFSDTKPEIDRQQFLFTALPEYFSVTRITHSRSFDLFFCIEQNFLQIMLVVYNRLTVYIL